MNEETYKKTITEFQMAIIKELFKNNKIGIKEYEYSINKLQKKLDNIIIPNGLINSVLDITI